MISEDHNEDSLITSPSKKTPFSSPARETFRSGLLLRPEVWEKIRKAGTKISIFRRAVLRILPALANARNPCPIFDVLCSPDKQHRHDAEDEKDTRSLRPVLRQTESSALALILPRSFRRKPSARTAGGKAETEIGDR